MYEYDREPQKTKKSRNWEIVSVWVRVPEITHKPQTKKLTPEISDLARGDTAWESRESKL